MEDIIDKIRDLKEVKEEIESRLNWYNECSLETKDKLGEHLIKEKVVNEKLIEMIFDVIEEMCNEIDDLVI